MAGHRLWYYVIRCFTEISRIKVIVTGKRLINLIEVLLRKSGRKKMGQVLFPVAFILTRS